MTRRYNPVTGVDHQYSWNALGQLDSATVISAINPSTGLRTTTVERYRYDASGRLVHIDRGDPSRNWLVYQGDQVSELIQSPTYYTDVAYDDGADRPAMEYVHGPPADVWRAEIMDALGNVAGAIVTDTIGVPYTWDAWGENTSTSWDNTEALGWKGLQPATGTGLIYMRARWYDPALGRFISEDPIGLGGGLNQYAFAGDDPINASDPSGLAADDSTGQLPRVIITAQAPNPYLNPNLWIIISEPADVPPSSLTISPQGLRMSGGKSDANVARKPSGVNWGKCLSAGASLGLAGLNTFAWLTGAGEAALAAKGAFALTRAVTRSIVTYGVTEATSRNLVLAGSETLLTSHAFNEPLTTGARIQAVAELFPVLDVVSTAITVRGACF